jgi:mannose-6-phosphate isomerase-like protein (cupin superfamily)
MIKHKANSKKYQWGGGCFGWHLLDNSDLSVIQESMPVDTHEGRHFHNNAQQFFYILAGIATFNIDGKNLQVKKHESIHIEKGQAHRIANKGDCQLEFLLISQPHAHGDRTEL